jgi:hypothetical protein
MLPRCNPQKRVYTFQEVYARRDRRASRSHGRIIPAVADENAFGILKQGSEAWNEWRKAHLSVVNPVDLVVDLSEADLRWADLSEADLHGADLHGANLSEADLRRADLRGADLRGADLRKADLSEADLGEADLSSANLSGANLGEARLIGANLIRASLNEADLSGANLNGAGLSGAHLIGSSLSGANLTGAEIGYTLFVNTDLSKVLGLESVTHGGPSSIGIDTIYKSKGQIPEIFLRNAGVPEPFIVQMKALVGAMEPIQFYSCFISYSSKDQGFAERLYADLQAKGVRCWFAPEDLKIGDRFQESIEDSIRVYDKVMIVLSEASVTSRWVEREVNAAREREERDGRLVLFPIRIDEAVMKAPQPWAADVRRTRHIGDFRNWHQHPTYRTAFDRLLRDLKASAGPTTE